MSRKQATSADGTRIAYEVDGEGTPILFIHEFAGDMTSWDDQVARFSVTHRCIRYAARGYFPSEVPASHSFSQAAAVEDALAVLDAEAVDTAHIVGISMGGYTAVNLTVQHPHRVRSAAIGGCGWGSDPATHARFIEESLGLASRLRQEGWPAIADEYGRGPTRIQLKDKNPATWARFVDGLSRHSSEGSAATMEGVQSRRSSLDSLIPGLRESARPLLIITGDEDEGCVEANFRVKRAVPTAAWTVFPRTGHTVNLEEPDAFNAALDKFHRAVEADAWAERNSRAAGFSSTGL